MLYHKPIFEILETETEDVICASIGGDYNGTDDGNHSSAEGSWVQPTN